MATSRDWRILTAAKEEVRSSTKSEKTAEEGGQEMDGFVKQEQDFPQETVVHVQCDSSCDLQAFLSYI